MKKLIIILFFGACIFGGYAQSTCWELSGNKENTRSDFLGTADCMPIVFKTNSVERMRLLNNKSFLGIGLSDPQAALHLHLQVDARPCEFSLSNATRTLLKFTTPETGSNSNNGFSILSFATKDLLFQQHERANFSIKGVAGGLLIDTAGNIGIATDHPLAKLHIKDGNMMLSKDAPAMLGVPNSAILFSAVLSPTNSGSWGIEYLTSNENAGLNFWRNNSFNMGFNSALFLSDGGHVGIGTTDPRARLDINGSLKAQSAEILGTVSANVLNVQKINIADTLSANHLHAHSANISDLTITPEGNIGIGTSNPIQKLHIEGNTYLDGNLGVGTGNPTQKLHVVGTTYLNGNVGIGTATPQAKLDVTGDIAATGTFTINKGNVGCVSLGSATGQSLSYGTSYLGFNATRNNDLWALSGDGAHNGGGVIWSTVGGDIYFAAIPSTNGSSKTLTDAEIRNNIKLHLSNTGKLKAKEVSVTLAGWPDFVFINEYKLLPLTEVEQYIKQNNRLPHVPSAAEVEKEGVNLGEMNAILLQKIEEVTLYIIDLQKQMDEMKQMKGEKK